MARTRVRAGDAEILREAKARFERCQTWESWARQNARNDAKFACGDSVNNWQWDDSVRNTRRNRPCLTLNKVRQHNLQIVNDARQHKAQIKVTPTGGKATYEAAQVFSGVIRRIEYQSKAVDAYSTAIYHQVESGIGYVRVVTDYSDEQSLDQEIFIRRVSDPNSIYLDPDAKEYDKSDMRFAFVFNDIPRDQFEAKYGRDEALAPAGSTLDHSDGWNDQDHVREAEYWRKGEEDDTLYKLMDGTIFTGSSVEPGDIERLRKWIVAERDVANPVVEWFLLRGNRVAERKEWAGRYIPIVPFIGEEIVIDGRMDRKGHTRALIDAQRMYNYWNSAAVEHVALQTKIPFIGPTRAIEGLEEQWNAANVENRSILVYNDIDDAGRPVERPERAQPPQMAQAYLQGLTIARDDMLMVSGQYQAEFGQPSNERSGAAIDARQRQSDNATAHYTDNQAKGIRQVGRICLDLIPKIYDTERLTQIMAEDGTTSDVHLVPDAPNAHQHVEMQPGGQVPITPEQAKAIDEDENNNTDVRVVFNPNVGKYDVESDVGPSYGTRREEAFNAFSQIMQQNPAAFQVVGDYWAQNADFPGADQLAERLRRGLPPQYKPGPSPQEQQLNQALQQTTQNAQQHLQKADAEIAMLKAETVRLQEQLKDKGDSIEVDAYEAETNRLKAVGQIDPTAMQVIVRQLVRDMLQEQLPGLIQHHGEMEQALQQNIQQAAPPPTDGADASAQSGATSG